MLIRTIHTCITTIRHTTYIADVALIGRHRIGSELIFLIKSDPAISLTISRANDHTTSMFCRPITLAHNNTVPAMGLNCPTRTVSARRCCCLSRVHLFFYGGLLWVDSKHDWSWYATVIIVCYLFYNVVCWHPCCPPPCGCTAGVPSLPPPPILLLPPISLTQSSPLPLLFSVSVLSSTLLLRVSLRLSIESNEISLDPCYCTSIVTIYQVYISSS